MSARLRPSRADLFDLPPHVEVGQQTTFILSTSIDRDTRQSRTRSEVLMGVSAKRRCRPRNRKQYTDNRARVACTY